MGVLRETITENTKFISNNHYSIFVQAVTEEDKSKVDGADYWVSVFRYKNGEQVKVGYISALGLELLYTEYIHS